MRPEVPRGAAAPSLGNRPAYGDLELLGRVLLTRERVENQQATPHWGGLPPSLFSLPATASGGLPSLAALHSLQRPPSSRSPCFCPLSLFHEAMPRKQLRSFRKNVDAPLTTWRCTFAVCMAAQSTLSPQEALGGTRRTGADEETENDSSSPSSPPP